MSACHLLSMFLILALLLTSTLATPQILAHHRVSPSINKVSRLISIPPLLREPLPYLSPVSVPRGGGEPSRSALLSWTNLLLAVFIEILATTLIKGKLLSVAFRVL